MSKKKMQSNDTQIVLPVTPMLDMTFQLMFFFLTTFNPPSAAEGQLDLSLPSKSDAAAKDPSAVSPISETHKEDIEDKSTVTINIRGGRGRDDRGTISYLTVAVDTGNEEEIKATKEDRERILAEKLDKVKPVDSVDKEGKKKVPTVRVAADSDVRWSEVMSIMDVCYKNGYQVSFVKPTENS
jgi:biopolymer transport protein ExbD